MNIWQKISVDNAQSVNLKVSGNLHMQRWEDADVGFVSAAEDIKVNIEEEQLYLRCYGDLDVRIPGAIPVNVDKVGGDAFIRNINSELAITKVGGNLLVQNADDVEISKIGGDCRLQNIHNSLNVERISGNLLAMNLGGRLHAETIRGDARLLTNADEIIVNAYGDITMVSTVANSSRIDLRSRGDLHLYLPKSPGISIDSTSSSRMIQVDMDGKSDTYEEKNYMLSIGESTGMANLKASGMIFISDEIFGHESFAEVFMSFDQYWDKYEENLVLKKRTPHISFRNYDVAVLKEERARRAAERIERRARKRASQLTDRLVNIRVDHLDNLNDLIEEDVERQIRAAMKDVDRVMQETEKKLKSVEINVPDIPIFNTPPERFKRPPASHTSEKHNPEPVSRSNQVGSEERLRVLKMVQDGKITAEQATELLRALAGN